MRRGLAYVSLPAPLFGSVAGVMLAGILPLSFVLATPSGGHASWVGALLVAILSGLRFGWLMLVGLRYLFEMVFWLFVYVFFGLAPIVQLRTEADPGTTPGLDHSKDWVAFLVVSFGCLAFLLGTLLPLARSNADAPLIREVSKGKVHALTFVAGIGALCYISLVGIGPLFSSRDSLAQAQSVFGESTTSSVVVAAVNMATFVAAAGQLLFLRQERAAHRAVSYVPAILSVMICVICVNPISSARYVVGTILLGLLAATGATESLRRFRWFSLSAIAGLVFIFPIADFFRHATTTAPVSNVLTSLKGGDFDAFGQVVNTVAYVDAFGTTNGNQALGVLLFWVPRSVWVSKPVDTGTLVANYKNYDFTNLSAPLWSELFINGGWVALVLGMAVLGVLLRRLDSSANTRLMSGLPSTVIGSVLPFYFLILCRGSLLQAMANLAAMLVFAAVISRRKVSPGAGVRSSTLDQRSMPL